jgi:S-adenosylmethionine synthetase
VEDEKDYIEVIEEIGDIVLGVAAGITEEDVGVKTNTADDFERERYYLTVTGTSAENGDDGQVGRGNRANGLITPYRPMTIEATAGKNPVSHVGKTYNVAAQEIVDTLIEEEPEIEQASCYIVSEIGAPITQPQAIDLEVFTDDFPSVTRGIEAIVEEVLDKMPKIWTGFLNREYELF